MKRPFREGEPLREGEAPAEPPRLSGRAQQELRPPI
jgi:hypothetical protein